MVFLTNKQNVRANTAVSYVAMYGDTNTNDPIEAIQLKIVVVFSNLDKAGVAVGVQETLQPVIMLLLFIWLEPCRKGFFQGMHGAVFSTDFIKLKVSIRSPSLTL